MKLKNIRLKSQYKIKNKNKYENRIENKLIKPERDIPINISTRGPETRFQAVGFLYRDETDPNYNINDTNRLTLFGRPEWVGSSKFDYFVSTSENSAMKIPLENEKEIYDDDEIEVIGFTGTFKVKLYDISKIRYIPYI
jgi:hypothetical protein